jgi:hypothetical protein
MPQAAASCKGESRNAMNGLNLWFSMLSYVPG